MLVLIKSTFIFTFLSNYKLNLYMANTTMQNNKSCYIVAMVSLLY